MVMSHLNCRTVVDVGANRGQFALLARHIFPQARIFSFEPLPKPAAVFRRIFSRDGSVILYEAAIGRTAGQYAMHVSGHDDSSSLLPISLRQAELFPGTGEVGMVDVQVRPLEIFVAVPEIVSPAILKIDVQGFELDALQGCGPLLSRFDWVYCECSFVELYSGQKLAPEVIDWLSRRGFRLRGVYNSVYDREGQAIQADFLFRRE